MAARELGHVRLADALALTLLAAERLDLFRFDTSRSERVAELGCRCGGAVG
jgi:hypothetical protein